MEKMGRATWAILLLGAMGCGRSMSSAADGGAENDATATVDARMEDRAVLPTVPIHREIVAGCVLMRPAPAQGLVGVFYTSECNCSATPGHCEVIEEGNRIVLQVGDREPGADCARCEQPNVCTVPYEMIRGREVTTHDGSWRTDVSESPSLQSLQAVGSSQCLPECAPLFQEVGISRPDCPAQPAPQPPPEWTCAAADYGTGNGCHCGCGTRDPDCSLLGADHALVGCESVQAQLADGSTAWCPLGECVDRCEGAVRAYRCAAGGSAWSFCGERGGRLDQNCDEGDRCEDGSRARCMFAGDCHEGESYCDGQTRRVCTHGQWSAEVCSTQCVAHPLDRARCAPEGEASVSATVRYRPAMGGTVPASGLLAQVIHDDQILGSAQVGEDGRVVVDVAAMPTDLVVLRVWAFWSYRALPRLAVLDPTASSDTVRSWDFSLDPTDANSTFVISGEGDIEFRLFGAYRALLQWYDELIAPADANPLRIAVGLDVRNECETGACFAPRAAVVAEPVPVDFRNSLILLRDDNDFIAAHEFGHAIDNHLRPKIEGVRTVSEGAWFLSEGYAHFVALLRLLALDGSQPVAADVNWELPDSPAVPDETYQSEELRSVAAALWDLVDDTPLEDPIHLPLGDVITHIGSPHFNDGDYGGNFYVDFLNSFVCSGAASEAEIRAIAELNDVEAYTEPDCR